MLISIMLLDSAVLVFIDASIKMDDEQLLSYLCIKLNTAQSYAYGSDGWLTLL